MQHEPVEKKIGNLFLELFIRIHEHHKDVQSHDLNISRTSLQHLMKDRNLKPYKPRLLQVLDKDDPDRRFEFCE